MEQYSIDIEGILLKQLEKIGIKKNIIPQFIKDIIHSFNDNPVMSLLQINSHLRFLGWDDVILDYHTYQLIKLYVETDNTPGKTRYLYLN
jgi:hypothetical protein